MKLKSYFSGTVEAAMALARQELGDEALLVNARPATPETRSLGAFEVVFGVLPASASAPAAPVPAASAAAGPAPGSDEIAALRREMTRLTQALRGARMPQADAPAEENGLRARLIDSDLDLDLVERAMGGTPLDKLFAVDATLGRGDALRAVVALVGPPGVGKTTTLVKLAVNYALKARRPAHIISTDVFRIAAADQLRSLACILGIGCTVVETPLALVQALEEHRGKEYVFIDTPGLGRADMQDGAELAKVIAAHSDIDTHLVLPASMRPADLSDVIDRYMAFCPAKLLFTRLDETRRFGALVNESARRSLPISFLAAGQQIPDDLEPATTEGLSALVYGNVAGVQKSMGATA